MGPNQIDIVEVRGSRPLAPTTETLYSARDCEDLMRSASLVIMVTTLFCVSSTPGRRSPRRLARTNAPRNDLHVAPRAPQVLERSFAGRGQAYTDEAKIAQLKRERTLGQFAAENALLKRVIKYLKDWRRTHGDGRSRRDL